MKRKVRKRLEKLLAVKRRKEIRTYWSEELVRTADSVLRSDYWKNIGRNTER